MPHERGALIDQLRALLTQQRYNSVVIHNYCRSAEHFVECLGRRGIAAEAATPDHVSSYLRFARRQFRRRHGHPPAPRWESIPRAGIQALLRLVQKPWPPEQPPASPAEAPLPLGMQRVPGMAARTAGSRESVHPRVDVGGRLELDLLIEEVSLSAMKISGAFRSP